MFNDSSASRVFHNLPIQFVKAVASPSFFVLLGTSNKASADERRALEGVYLLTGGSETWCHHVRSFVCVRQNQGLSSKCYQNRCSVVTTVIMRSLHFFSAEHSSCSIQIELELECFGGAWRNTGTSALLWLKNVQYFCCKYDVFEIDERSEPQPWI